MPVTSEYSHIKLKYYNMHGIFNVQQVTIIVCAALYIKNCPQNPIPVDTEYSMHFTKRQSSSKPYQLNYLINNYYIIIILFY